MSSSHPSSPTNGAGPPAKVTSPPPISTLAKAAPARGSPSNPYQLDVAKLHSLPSDQQGLYLLTFAADLANHIESLSPDSISEKQAAFRKELYQIIHLTQPAPTRVIRNNLGRCFAAIFEKGNRKLLYETINDLVGILNAGKDKAIDLRTKHAALSCLGVVFGAAGDSAVSLSPLAATAALKLLKPASGETAVRAAIFTAIARITKGIHAPIDEDIGRSIFKAARKAAESDRSLLVQQCACQCVEQLVRCTSFFDNSNDFDRLQTALYKAMDTSCVTVRHAAASCLAVELVKSFRNSPDKEAVPKIRKPKKAKKSGAQDDDGDVPERGSSPAPDKSSTMLSHSLVDMLRVLSLQYCRPTTTNRTRAGIAVCYVKVLRTLGEAIVEADYGNIARHTAHRAFAAL